MVAVVVITVRCPYCHVRRQWIVMSITNSDDNFYNKDRSIFSLSTTWIRLTYSSITFLNLFCVALLSFVIAATLSLSRVIRYVFVSWLVDNRVQLDIDHPH
jgi:hypothetical protein